MTSDEVEHSSAIHSSPATTVGEALALIRESGADCLMVVESGRMVGVVTEHDLAHPALREGLGPADSVEAALTRDAIFLCPERIPS